MKAPGLVAFSRTTETATPWPLTDYLKVMLNSEVLNSSRRFYNCPLNIVSVLGWKVFVFQVVAIAFCIFCWI